MASSKSTILKSFSGGIGKQVVLKQYGDKTVLSAYPNMSKRVLSPKQLENNKLMKKANMTAKGILKNPKMRDAEQLRLNVTRNKLYTALIRDFFQNARAKKTSS
jgi:hypothetical protein